MGQLSSYQSLVQNLAFVGAQLGLPEAARPSANALDATSCGRTWALLREAFAKAQQSGDQRARQSLSCVAKKFERFFSSNKDFFQKQPEFSRELATLQSNIQIFDEHVSNGRGFVSQSLSRAYHSAAAAAQKALALSLPIVMRHVTTHWAQLEAASELIESKKVVLRQRGFSEETISKIETVLAPAIASSLAEQDRSGAVPAEFYEKTTLANVLTVVVNITGKLRDGSFLSEKLIDLLGRMQQSLTCAEDHRVREGEVVPLDSFARELSEELCTLAFPGGAKDLVLPCVGSAIAQGTIYRSMLSVLETKIGEQLRKIDSAIRVPSQREAKSETGSISAEGQSNALSSFVPTFLGEIAGLTMEGTLSMARVEAARQHCRTKLRSAGIREESVSSMEAASLQLVNTLYELLNNGGAVPPALRRYLFRQPSDGEPYVLNHFGNFLREALSREASKKMVASVLEANGLEVLVRVLSQANPLTKLAEGVADQSATAEDRTRAIMESCFSADLSSVVLPGVLEPFRPVLRELLASQVTAIIAAALPPSHEAGPPPVQRPPLQGGPFQVLSSTLGLPLVCRALGLPPPQQSGQPTLLPLVEDLAALFIARAVPESPAAKKAEILVGLHELGVTDETQSAFANLMEAATASFLEDGAIAVAPTARDAREGHAAWPPAVQSNELGIILAACLRNKNFLGLIEVNLLNVLKNALLSIKNGRFILPQSKGETMLGLFQSVCFPRGAEDLIIPHQPAQVRQALFATFSSRLATSLNGALQGEPQQKAVPSSGCRFFCRLLGGCLEATAASAWAVEEKAAAVQRLGLSQRAAALPEKLIVRALNACKAGLSTERPPGAPSPYLSQCYAGSGLSSLGFLLKHLLENEQTFKGLEKVIEANVFSAIGNAEAFLQQVQALSLAEIRQTALLFEQDGPTPQAQAASLQSLAWALHELYRKVLFPKKNALKLPPALAPFADIIYQIIDQQICTLLPSFFSLLEAKLTAVSDRKGGLSPAANRLSMKPLLRKLDQQLLLAARERYSGSQASDRKLLHDLLAEARSIPNHEAFLFDLVSEFAPELAPIMPFVRPLARPYTKRLLALARLPARHLINLSLEIVDEQFGPQEPPPAAARRVPISLSKVSLLLKIALTTLCKFLLKISAKLSSLNASPQRAKRMTLSLRERIRELSGLNATYITSFLKKLGEKKGGNRPQSAD